MQETNQLNQNVIIEVISPTYEDLIKSNPEKNVFLKDETYKVINSLGEEVNITLPFTIEKCLVRNGEEKFYLMKPYCSEQEQESLSGAFGSVQFAKELNLNSEISSQEYPDEEYQFVRKKLFNHRINKNEVAITELATEKNSIICCDESGFIIDRLHGVFGVVSPGCGYEDWFLIHLTKLYLEELSRLYDKGISHGDATFSNAVYNEIEDKITLFDFGKSAAGPGVLTTASKLVSWEEGKIHHGDFRCVKEVLEGIVDILQCKESKEILLNLTDRICHKDKKQRMFLNEAIEELKVMECDLKTKFEELVFNEFIDQFMISFDKAKILFFEPPSEFMKKYRSGQITNLEDIKLHIDSREGKSCKSRYILAQVEVKLENERHVINKQPSWNLSF